MTVIYEPKGKAREYAPLALNHYRGCDHGCSYCYVPAIFARDSGYVHSDVKPRENVIEQLQKELKHGAPDKQILLSFTGDPYCHADVLIELTRRVLKMLSEAKAMIAVLTKGGTRCLRDIDLFKSWPSPLKVGATLTFLTPAKSEQHEPHASLPVDRLIALRELHEAGVRTWASIEPVIEPKESLAVIRESLPFVDEYKIGKLNHVENNTDWAQFLRDAVAIMREARKPFYLKEDLRAYCPPDVQLSPEECDMDYLTLKRPWNYRPGQAKEAQARLFG